MTYTASVTEKSFSNGTATIVVEFKDDKEQKFSETFTTRNCSNDQWLRQVAIGRVQDLLETCTFVNNLKLGSIDLTPIPPVEQTDAEKAMIVWKKKMQKLSRMKSLVDFGILSSDNTNYVTLIDEVRKTFDSTYLDSL